MQVVIGLQLKGVLMLLNFKKILKNKYFRILIVSFFIVLVAVQSNKSLVLDEIDFPIVAHATSLTYKPIYYRGEQSAFHVGTYHPTLYINSLALFIRAFGYNEITVRFFGVVCTLISAYLLLLILRRLIKKNEASETLLLGLFLLNPYTIANTTLPDIDCTVLPVVLLLFIYFSIKYLLQKNNLSNRVTWILGSLFALALWSKLTTPMIIPPFLACLSFITTKKFKESIVFALKVTLIGSIGFILSYFLYCKLLGLSTTYTYHFLIDSFTKGTSSDGPVTGALKNLGNIRYFVYWPTLPLVVLFGVSSIGIILDKDKSDTTKIKKLLVVTGLLVTLFYIALIAPFGGFFKYPFPVFGISILSIVLFYDRYLQKFKLNTLYGAVSLIFGFVIEKIFWEDKMFTNARPFEGFVILFLLVAISYYLLIRDNTQRIAASFFILLILFSIGFQLSISRIQAMSPYPTKYHYGQTGLDETTSYLRANTTSKEIIWSMKDVGYYVNNKYIESYGYYFDKSLENNLINLLKGSKVKYYVVSTGIGEDNINYYPRIKQILDTYAVREKQFGNFIIYKSKG